MFWMLHHVEKVIWCCPRAALPPSLLLSLYFICLRVFLPFFFSFKISTGARQKKKTKQNSSPACIIFASLKMHTGLHLKIHLPVTANPIQGHSRDTTHACGQAYTRTSSRYGDPVKHFSCLYVKFSQYHIELWSEVYILSSWGWMSC